MQALMLIHVRNVHRNILHNINSADVANEFLDKRDSRKQTLRHFYQSYSKYMYITCSRLTFYHSFNRFPQANGNRISAF